MIVNNIIENSGLEVPYYPVGSGPKEAFRLAKVMAELLSTHYGANTLFFLLARGSSGLILSSMLSVLLGNTVIIHIKKEGETSHTDNTWKSPASLEEKVIIVDDLISSGLTVKAIYDKWTGTHTRPIDAIIVGGSVNRTRNLSEVKVDTLFCQHTYGNIKAQN